jgi:hypothetical protein
MLYCGYKIITSEPEFTKTELVCYCAILHPVCRLTNNQCYAVKQSLSGKNEVRLIVKHRSFKKKIINSLNLCDRTKHNLFLLGHSFVLQIYPYICDLNITEHQQNFLRHTE